MKVLPWIFFLLAFVISVYPIYQSRVVSRAVQEAEIEAILEGGDRDASRLDVGLQLLTTLGVLEVPTIDLRMPIYEGTSEKALSVACGTMPKFGGLSGKRGTHPVLTSHNGMPGQNLFSNLKKLRKGDTIYLLRNGSRLIYEVFDIKTVLPTDEEAFYRGKEATVTLLTCTPEGINSHRLLVTGKLVGQVPLTEDVETEPFRLVLSTYELFVLGFWSLLFVVGIFRGTYLLGVRKGKKLACQDWTRSDKLSFENDDEEALLWDEGE